MGLGATAVAHVHGLEHLLVCQASSTSAAQSRLEGEVAVSGRLDFALDLLADDDV